MIVEVSVIPNSRRFVIAVKDGKVKISLKSAPEQNRANIELVRELSKTLGTDVRIISGQSSKRKKLEIGLTPEEWERFLKPLK